MLPLQVGMVVHLAARALLQQVPDCAHVLRVALINTLLRVQAHVVIVQIGMLIA